jgi:hypothetical protein
MHFLLGDPKKQDTDKPHSLFNGAQSTVILYVAIGQVEMQKKTTD